MPDTIRRELATLEKMTTAELVQRYEELHGRVCRTRHRAYLKRKIAWRIQAIGPGIAQGPPPPKQTASHCPSGLFHHAVKCLEAQQGRKCCESSRICRPFQ